MRAAPLVVLILAGACASSSPDVAAPGTATVTPAEAAPTVVEATPTPVDDASEPAPTATATPTPTPEPLFPVAPADVGGVVTSTGIPLEVLARVDDDVVVRTPCGDTAVVSGATPLTGISVVIDPGHGGPVDTGVVGPNGLVERDLNLTVSEAVLDELEALDHATVLTRTADYHTLLATRAALADALGADLMVSIHHNAPSPGPSELPGPEVFVQSQSSESARLGGLLYEEAMAAFSAVEGVTWTRAADAGVLLVLNTEGGDAYGMIRRPATPTALVELGYLSAPSEAAFMATEEYVEVAAEAVATAIDRWLTTEDPGDGFVDQPRVFDPARAPGAEVCDDPALE